LIIRPLFQATRENYPNYPAFIKNFDYVIVSVIKLIRGTSKSNYLNVIDAKDYNNWE